MRVLVIGCGYVGLPLAVELAKQGHQVFGLRRSAHADADLQAAGITPLHADITKLETLVALPERRFDWVVNCSATGGGGPEDYRQLYLEGSRNLLKWLSDSPPKKFVYTSSTGVYGQNDGSVVDESSTTNPDSETAGVLVETEKLLLDEARRRKFLAVILRVAGIYGPDRGYLLKQFLKGEARIEGNGERVLNMIHRDDLIKVIIAALQNGTPGEIYNAVDDEPVRQRDFFTWLAATMKRELPPSVSEINSPNRKRGTTNKRISNHKLKAEFGFQFQYPTFREGYQAELPRLRKQNL